MYNMAMDGNVTYTNKRGEKQWQEKMLCLCLNVYAGKIRCSFKKLCVTRLSMLTICWLLALLDSLFIFLKLFLLIVNSVQL